MLPDDWVGGTTLDPMGEQWSRPRGGARVRSDKHGSVSVDALVLAFASVVRPLSVAAVYAMLSTPRPTRLLTAYIGAGFVFSTGLGSVLVILLGESAGRTPDEARAAIAFILGAVSLGYAAGLLSGRFQGPARDTMRPVQARLQLVAWPSTGRPVRTPRGCRGADPQAGAVLPAALGAIGNSTSSNAGRIFQVALYNAIWLPCRSRPWRSPRANRSSCRTSCGGRPSGSGAASEEIMIAAFGLLGAYLIVRGVVELQS